MNVVKVYPLTYSIYIASLRCVVLKPNHPPKSLGLDRSVGGPVRHGWQLTQVRDYVTVVAVEAVTNV